MGHFRGCRSKKTKNNQKPKQKQNKQTNKHTQQNKKGRVINWSVRNVGNLKKGDSIVSSLVSSGIGMASNQTQQNRQQSQKPPHTYSVSQKKNSTTLSGNQGSPARSLEITQCKPHGQQDSQNWGKLFSFFLCCGRFHSEAVLTLREADK